MSPVFSARSPFRLGAEYSFSSLDRLHWNPSANLGNTLIFRLAAALHLSYQNAVVSLVSLGPFSTVASADLALSFSFASGLSSSSFPPFSSTPSVHIACFHEHHLLSSSRGRPNHGGVRQENRSTSSSRLLRMLRESPFSPSHFCLRSNTFYCYISRDPPWS